MEVKFEINKIIHDEFGRPSGIIVVDKVAGISAHDVVDNVRKVLNYSKVGHAGALDTFSTGLMLILIGRATKLSDKLMSADKKYTAKMVLGISTETQDIEGNILRNNPMELSDTLKKNVSDVITSFQGGYEQFVSIFSSVKVEGKKLRKILRDPRYKYSVRIAEDGKKFLDITHTLNGSLYKSLEVPKRFIEINNLEVVKIYENVGKNLGYEKFDHTCDEEKYVIVEFDIHCSKGAYIRQLAEDIGEKLELPSSLIALRRTSIGNIDESMVIDDKFWEKPEQSA